MRPETMAIMNEELEGFLATQLKILRKNLHSVESWASYGIGKENMTEPRRNIIDLQRQIIEETSYLLRLIQTMKVNSSKVIEQRINEGDKVTRWLYVDGKLVEVDVEEAARAQGLSVEALLEQERAEFADHYYDFRSTTNDLDFE